MKTLLRRLWNDQSGALLSAEYLLLATILGIGLIVGIKTVRDAIVEELHELAVAISQLDFGNQNAVVNQPLNNSADGEFQVAADAFPEG